jgi:hypothetical protein
MLTVAGYTNILSEDIDKLLHQTLTNFSRSHELQVTKSLESVLYHFKCVKHLQQL